MKPKENPVPETEETTKEKQNGKIVREKDSKRRVVYLTLDFIKPIFSGNGTLSRLQILGLVNNGFEVMVVCPEGRLEEDEELNALRIKNTLKIEQVPLQSTKDLGINSDYQGFFDHCMRRIANIKRFSPSKIVAIDWHTIDIACKLREELMSNSAIPIMTQYFRIFTYFEKGFASTHDFQEIRRREEIMAREASEVIVLSAFDRKWVQERGGHTVHLLYPPVTAPSKFIREPLIRTKNSEGYRLITVSRLVPEKNIERIFPILEELKRLDIEFTYILIGEHLDRVYWAFIQKEIQTRNLTDLIIFKKKIPLEELIAEIHRSDCYIHTANYEPFGISIIEAALAGCPVVLDKNGLIGAAEILLKSGNEIERNGALGIDFEKPHESAQKIKQLLEDPKFSSKLQKNGIRFASELTEENYISELIKILGK